MRKQISMMMIAAFFVAGAVSPAMAGTSASWLKYNGWNPTHEITISGMVEHTSSGLALVTGGGHVWQLKGENLSSEVGQKVAAEGTFTKAFGKDVFTVDSYRTCDRC
jgi:Protein of unknown function (DUF5818)